MKSSSATFLFRVWLRPEDSPTIQVWYLGLEELNLNHRLVEDWCYEAFSNEDFYQRLGLDKEKFYQVYGKATVTGSFDYYGEYDEDIELHSCECEEIVYPDLMP